MCAVHHGNLSKHLKQKHCAHEFNCNLANSGKDFLSRTVTHLHADDSVDEEQHGYQKGNIWQSLQAKEREKGRLTEAELIFPSFTDQIIVV